MWQDIFVALSRSMMGGGALRTIPPNHLVILNCNRRNRHGSKILRLSKFSNLHVYYVNCLYILAFPIIFRNLLKTIYLSTMFNTSHGWCPNLPCMGGLRGGWKSITPLLSEISGECTPLVFDLEQVIYDHRQVGKAEKNGDAPKVTCLNFGQQCFICLYFKLPKLPKETKLS